MDSHHRWKSTFDGCIVLIWIYIVYYVVVVSVGCNFRNVGATTTDDDDDTMIRMILIL